MCVRRVWDDEKKRISRKLIKSDRLTCDVECIFMHASVCVWVSVKSLFEIGEKEEEGKKWNKKEHLITKKKHIQQSTNQK